MTILRFTKRTADGFVISAARFASLSGATQLDTQLAAIDANPLRALRRARCLCGYRWQAPTIARCPQCHSERVALEDMAVCMAARL